MYEHTHMHIHTVPLNVSATHGRPSKPAVLPAVLSKVAALWC